MAEKPVPGAAGKAAAPSPAPEKALTVTVECVRRYGRHEVGAVIEVSEREYKRCGPAGTGALVSTADKAAKQRASADATSRAKPAPNPTAKAAEQGWAALSKESRQRVAEMQVAQARAQVEVLDAAARATAARG